MANKSGWFRKRGFTSGWRVLLALALMACASGKASAEKLVLPYDRPSPDTRKSADSFLTCPKAPEPPRDMIFRSIYEGSDSYRATVNPKAKEEYRQDTALIKKFENDLVRMANTYLRTGSQDASRCVLDWLYAWAKKKAMLGKVNNTGLVVRQWALASAASAFSQIAGAPDLDVRRQKKVKQWLSKCARAVIADYPENGQRVRQNNNHLYWGAWGVTMTGIAIGKRDYYEWGMKRATLALLQQPGNDGTLPLEMSRGPRALQYHIIAIMPLVLLAEAGLRNGDDLYAVRNGILHRMVKRVLKGLGDDSYFREKSGFSQIDPRSMDPSYFGWMEVYQARFPDKKLVLWLEEYRPVFMRRAGGDMTYLYRVWFR